MRKCSIFIAAMVIGASTMAVAADWAQWRGPSANGFAPDTKINKTWNKKAPKTLWTVSLSDDGYAGMSAAAGKIFIVDHQGKQDIVRAIDMKTGKDVWKYAYDDADRSNYGFAGCSPVVDGTKVYTISRMGMLNCLDVKTGKAVWSRQIMTDFSSRVPGWGCRYTPLIDGTKLIAYTGGKGAGVVALDKLTGKTIWQGGPDDMFSYSSPVAATINGKKQYVTFTSAGLFGIDPANGSVLWNQPWKTGSDCNAATPVVIGNSIFITTSYNHGAAVVDVTADGAKLRWEKKDMQSHFSTPLFYKGYIYGTSDSGGALMCIDPANGDLKWKKEGFEKGAVVGVDGVMIAQNGDGGDLVMVEFSPESYKELGRIKPIEGKQCWVAPIVTNGLLLARTKNTLACIALK